MTGALLWPSVNPQAVAAVRMCVGNEREIGCVAAAISNFDVSGAPLQLNSDWGAWVNDFKKGRTLCAVVEGGDRRVVDAEVRIWFLV
jgi:hypothetical protein